MLWSSSRTTTGARPAKAHVLLIQTRAMTTRRAGLFSKFALRTRQLLSGQRFVRGLSAPKEDVQLTVAA